MTKPRYVRRKPPEMLLIPSDFIHMRKLIYTVLSKAPRIGGWLTRLYVTLWNPINYAMIGGVGVLINYLVWMVTMPFLPWFLSNLCAIGVAFLWNWSQSVGHFSYLWGFRRKDAE